MKYFWVLLLFVLSACSADFVENRETRSTVYQGQTTWDLFENFGAPSYAERIAPNEFRFVYQREAITRDWSHMFLDWCDMTFVVVDDRVRDWHYSGNQCHLNVEDPVPVSNDTNERSRQNPRAEKSSRETLF